MTPFFRLFRLILPASFFICTAAYSFEVDYSFDLTGGYRRDEIETLIDVYDLADTFLYSNKLKGKDIDLYQVGISGWGTMCGNWFLRGFANFGRVEDGKYSEISDDGEEKKLSTAKIYDGNTKDFSVGLGYFFPCSPCFKIGPIAGWAYDYQRIKMKDGQTDGVADPVFNGLVYKTRWRGPWVGVETDFFLYCFRFRSGYEYHFPYWRARWLLAGEPVQEKAFSDKRKAHPGFGDVFFFNSYYSFCNCWDIGAGFKYQYWKAVNGRETPLSGSFDNPTEVDKIPHTTWKSFEISAILNVYF